MTKAGMDAAIESAVTAAMDKMHGAREAEIFVRPWVGNFAPETSMALDSAEAVYKHTLKVLGHSPDPSWNVTAMKTLIAALPKPSAARREQASFAMDAATSGKSFEDMFPNVKRIGVDA